MRRAEADAHRSRPVEGARGRRAVAALLAAALLLAACSDGASAPTGDAPADAAPQVAEPPAQAPAEPERDDAADEPTAPPPPPEEPPPVPASRDALVAHLGPLVAAAAERSDGSLGVLVTDAHGREVVAHRPDTPLMPASTMKTVTAAALLVTLGPDARLTTLVESTAPVDGDGTLDGDLAVLGVGDPVLATDRYGRWIYPARPRTPFDDLAEQLVDLGLTRVTGDVIGVVDGFAGDTRAEGWPDRYFADFDARHIAGLTVDAGLITRMRYPDLEAALADAEEEADRGADVDDDPVDGGADDGVLDLTDDELDDLTPQELAERLGLDGPGAPDVRVDHTDDPAGHTAGELVRLLEERGVQVDGEARAGPAPEPIVGRLASVQSPPMQDLLAFALKRSDNHLTDQLFHIIGRVRTGEGSWERGERAVRQVLDHLGVDHDGARFADGSGLSRDDRLTARLLVDLDRAMSESRHGERWHRLMAVMGEDGTLERRLRGTPAQGRFHGKTGTLRDVTALSGAVLGDDGERYHLAVLANDPGAGRWAARALMDEIVLALAADLESCTLRTPDAGDGPLGVPPSAVVC